MENSISPEILSRTPRMRPEWLPTLERMREHPDSPRWNAQCGDRLEEADIPFIRAFEERLHVERPTAAMSEETARWIFRMNTRSAYFAQALSGVDWERDFSLVPRMTRRDMQSRLHEIVPADEPLWRIVVNPTSGTTGQPIQAPNHPRAVGCYEPMILYILSRYGVREVLDHSRIAAIQLCAQKRTITYNTVHSYSNGAGFAKINLAPGEWRRAQSPDLFTRSMAPLFYSGDPFAFLEAERMGLSYQPRLLLSTATALEPEARRVVEAHFRCRAAELYSLNETGPVAYGCPDHSGKYHLLPHDLYVEIADEAGNPLAPGGTGEILVTGGRNPFLPLLRYRTGDIGVLDLSPCSCGETSPSLYLQGRKTVLYRGEGGASVNPVDIARAVRQYPVRQYRFRQQPDGSCTLELYAHVTLPKSSERTLLQELDALFGRDGTVALRYTAEGWEGKV